MNLERVSREEYGDHYSPHILEIYKMYVNMADKVSSRRQSANSYFLTLNTAIIAILSYIEQCTSQVIASKYSWIVSFAGIVLSYSWYRLIRSYKDLNSGKFKVVHHIEKYLPIAPYDAEWKAIGEGKDKKLYLPFTKVEMRVPWIFFGVHLFVFAQSFPWKKVCQYFI